MADITVTPNALAITAAIQAPTVFDVQTILPTTLAIVTALEAPTIFDVQVVLPTTLDIGIAVQVPTVFDVQTILPDTLEIAVSLRPPIVNPFPTLSRKPSHTFSDEKTDESVLIANMASGYPLLNKQFTFDPRTFSFDLASVSEADKITIMNYYENNKDTPFYWLNVQDNTQYEVVFISKPRCRVEGRYDLWRISLELRQASSETV